MSKYFLDNEKKIKEYLQRKRIKFAESTIKQMAKAIEKYQEFSGYEDFKKFNFKKAENYIKYLRNANLAKSTINHYLIHLRDFLEWLSSQTSYKTALKVDDIEILSISNNELNEINKSIDFDYPTIEQAKAIFNAIEPENDIAKRDKALIAFSILTGMRAESLRTLTVGAINIDKMEVMQSQKTGVKTKFGKDILTKIFNFDNDMRNYFVEWYKYLKQEKLYSNNDPVFPMSKVSCEENSYSFICNDIEPKFWQAHSSISKVFKERAENVNLPQFSPHKYRHLSIYLALEKCSNGLEIKAISQHFGHEDIRTALEVYSNLSSMQLSKTLDKIDANSKKVLADDDLELAQQLINQIRGQ